MEQIPESSHKEPNQVEKETPGGGEATHIQATTDSTLKIPEIEIAASKFNFKSSQTDAISKIINPITEDSLKNTFKLFENCKNMQIIEKGP